MPDRVTALILGDLVGRSGCRAVISGLAGLIKRHSADIVVVNGENAADGYGITPEISERLFAAGAQVVTTGNHVWQQKEIYDYLDREPRLLRPANYPGGNPGSGLYRFDVQGVGVVVASLQGRVRMRPIDCPFKKSRELLRKHKKEASVWIVDFHAESTEEKEALACYLDGEVSVIFGTHTHVQTADERIFPKGTAYITDVGSTAPVDSVIGFDPEIGVRRALTQMPLKNQVSDNRAMFSGLVVSIDAASGKALTVSRIREESLV